MHHQIVTGSRLHSQRRAGERRDADRAQTMPARRHAVHHVTDVGSWNVTKLRHKRGVHFRLHMTNLESDGQNTSPLLLTENG